MSNKTVIIPFIGIENELQNIESAGLHVTGMKSNNGIPEVSISGYEIDIRKYLARLWFDDESAIHLQEIDELFE